MNKYEKVQTFIELYPYCLSTLTSEQNYFALSVDLIMTEIKQIGLITIEYGIIFTQSYSYRFAVIL